MRRGRLELYFSVLKVLKEKDQKLTWISQKTNTNFTIASDIVADLESAKFVRKYQNHEGRYYKITRKGLHALSFHVKMLNSIQEIIV